MSMQQRWTVIGIFEDQDKARQAMDDLHAAGFSEDAIGFVYRGDVSVVSRADVEAEENVGGFTSGIIGGITGAAEALLTPILGPSVANTIPMATMPVAEQAIERLQTGGEHGGQQPGVVVAEAAVAEGEQENTAANATRDEIENTPTKTLGEKQTSVSAEPVPEVVEAVGDNPTALPGETAPEDGRRIREEEATGAFTGGIVGGVLGAAVALLIPVLGPAFAGGILVTVFSAALGAVTGGFLGVFAALGVPEEQAHHYEQEFKAGRTIITVKTEERQQDALDILYRNDARYANTHALV